MTVEHVPDRDPTLMELHDAAFAAVADRIEQEGPTRAGLLPVSWLDPAEVAREAGLDVSVFDELYPSGQSGKATDAALDPFEQFLWHTFSVNRSPTVTEDKAESMSTHLDDLDDLIRLDAACQTLSEAEWLSHLITLSVSAFTGHERADYATYIEEVTFLCEVILYQFDLRMREPLTARDLAMCLGDAFEGPWFRRMYGNPDPNPTRKFAVIPGSEVKEWSLDAITAWAIVQIMTEPID